MRSTAKPSPGSPAGHANAAAGRRIVSLVLWLVVALLLAGSGRSAAESGQGMRVELDAFSGRPNPAWDLTQQEAAQVQGLITGLPPSARPMSEDGLGYRGFVIRDAAALAAPGGDEVRVFGGVVRVTSGTQVRDYEDARGLEAVLEVQARQHGYGDIIDWSRGGTP